MTTRAATKTSVGWGVLILARDEVRVRLAQTQAPEALPVLTYSDAITIHLNDDEVHAFPVPPGHTDGDSFIHFRHADVLHLGDVFRTTGFPYIDLANGGTLDGTIAALGVAIGMAGPDTRIIPGHGGVSTREDVIEFRDMILDVKARVRRTRRTRDVLRRSRRCPSDRRLRGEVGGSRALPYRRVRRGRRKRLRGIARPSVGHEGHSADTGATEGRIGRARTHRSVAHSARPRLTNTTSSLRTAASRVSGGSRSWARGRPDGSRTCQASCCRQASVPESEGLDPYPAQVVDVDRAERRELRGHDLRCEHLVEERFETLGLSPRKLGESLFDLGTGSVDVLSSVRGRRFPGQRTDRPSVRSLLRYSSWYSAPRPWTTSESRTAIAGSAEKGD